MPSTLTLLLKKLSITKRFALGFATMFLSLSVMGILYGLGFFHNLHFFDKQINQSHLLQQSIEKTITVNQETVTTFDALEAKYPELNPKSNQFIQGNYDYLVGRFQYYLAKYPVKNTALDLALDDYRKALNANKKPSLR